jgi:hypothetical protein
MALCGAYGTEEKTLDYAKVNLCFYIKSTFDCKLEFGLLWKGKPVPKHGVIIELNQDVQVRQISWGVTTLSCKMTKPLILSPDTLVELPQCRTSLKNYLEGSEATFEGSKITGIFGLLRAFVGITLGGEYTISEHTEIKLDPLYWDVKI